MYQQINKNSAEDRRAYSDMGEYGCAGNCSMYVKKDESAGYELTVTDTDGLAFLIKGYQADIRISLHSSGYDGRTLASMMRSVPVHLRKRVVELSLENNDIEYIPVEIVLFPNLAVLNLYENKVTEIPEHLSRMRHLVKLNLTYNLLEKISPEFAQGCESLAMLMIAGNEKIKELPEEIFLNHPALSHVDIDGDSRIEVSDDFWKKFQEKIERMAKHAER